MGLSSGTGSPHFFHCPVARRNRDYRTHRLPKGHIITLTGRTKPRDRGGRVGDRSTLVVREYQCSCGHIGWSNHVDLERMERRAT
jgi:hypothetical protein